MTITRDELNRALNAIILTLDEIDAASVSSLYLGLGNNAEKWNLAKEVLVRGDLAIFKEDNTVSLTSKGRDMAVKIREFRGEVLVKH